VADVAQQFTQGNITATENPLDLAINGNGFFQLDAGGATVYSRNGQFQLDRNGNITNAGGQKLLGYAAAADGTIIPSTVQALQLPTSGVAPAATTNIALELNLDSRAAVTKPAAAPLITFADPTSYNNATSVTVFDAKGQEVAMTYYFQKTAADNWNVYATANGSPVVDSGGNVAPITTLTFAANGSAPTSPTAPVAFDVPATTNSTGGATLPIAGVLFDVSKATQFGSAFGVTDMKQDGYAAGLLTGIAVENNGIITARYSNGQSRPAGQIEFANFRNPQGLQPVGDNAWARTFASGEPVTGVPGDGNLGVLQSGALEESNVDLTGELVNMITAQRIYQANAQTIKTQDQVLQTLVNLR